MSIGPSSPGRGCAAFFRQPVTGGDELGAQALVNDVYHFNCRVPDPPLLSDIVYRSGSGQEDILRHVFRWDRTPPTVIFENGFICRRQEGTPDDVYYSLDHYVHHGGRPTDSQQPTTHAFISTTVNPGWHPTISAGTSMQIYRYEIYAPGGISVASTLGQYYEYPAQDEVCFVAGIAPQYIRSAQRFRLTADAGSRYTRRERVDNELVINEHINPQSHPYEALPIRNPVDYCMENGRRVPLNITYHSEMRLKKRSTDSIVHWYAVEVAGDESYINAAFRSSRTNEAYLFMKNEYVLVNYAPGTTDDRVVNGPLFICEGYPSLAGTTFAEYGIDCAFGSSSAENEAYIFSGNLCALINYAPGTTDDWIIRGPITITKMFPFMKGSVFESGIDAAFESKTKYEAYIFKDDQNARINYEGSGSITVRSISEGFPCLKDTIFKNGVDAAFASHRHKDDSFGKKVEAYLFKGDSYALISFEVGTDDEEILGGVKKLKPNWPSLEDILPRKNHGLDVHDHSKPDADRDHDEL